MNLKAMSCEVVAFSQIAQDRVKWQAPVNKVRNIWFHKKQRIS